MLRKHQKKSVWALSNSFGCQIDLVKQLAGRKNKILPSSIVSSQPFRISLRKTLHYRWGVPGAKIHDLFFSARKIRNLLTSRIAFAETKLCPAVS